jgi:hypothetical protein
VLSKSVKSVVIIIVSKASAEKSLTLRQWRNKLAICGWNLNIEIMWDHQEEKCSTVKLAQVLLNVHSMAVTLNAIHGMKGCSCKSVVIVHGCFVEIISRNVPNVEELTAIEQVITSFVVDATLLHTRATAIFVVFATQPNPSQKDV